MKDAFFGSRFSVALLRNLADFSTEIHFGCEKHKHANAPNNTKDRPQFFDIIELRYCIFIQSLQTVKEGRDLNAGSIVVGYEGQISAIIMISADIAVRDLWNQMVYVFSAVLLLVS